MLARPSVRDRLLEKVVIDPESPGLVNGSPCWVWTAGLDTSGYARFKRNGRHVSGHVAAYELWVDRVPEGMELDHLCHTLSPDCPGGIACEHRRCVNPAHLEPVTGLVNTLRGHGVGTVNAAKEFCPENHEYSGANLYVRPSDGARICRACAREHARKYRERKRTKVT